MAVLNIRNVDESLMRAVNVEAAREGRTLRDWVIGALAQKVGWENGEDRLNSRTIDRVDARAVPEIEVGNVHRGSLVEEDEVEDTDCPQCGSTLAWNKVMRWWECVEQSCQWHGKKER